MRLVPPAELESVKLSLVKQKTQHLFPIHRTNPSIFKPGSKPEGYGNSFVKPRRANTKSEFLRVFCS
jgi:hypothetical protein